MTGWDWAQWAVILGMGGAGGWLAWRGMSALARLTSALTATHAMAVAWQQQCRQGQADVKGAIQAGEAADRALREDLALAVAGVTADLARVDARVTATGATLTESLTYAQADAAAWKHQCVQVHASFDGAIQVGETADRAVQADLVRLTGALELTAKALRDDLKTCQASCVVTEQRVVGLTTMAELALAAVQARENWQIDTSAAAVGAFDALLQQHYADKPSPSGVTGWRYVLRHADGSVESVRRATDGNAPMRIERGHGRDHSWYRLTSIDGHALIYTPEPQA